MIICWINYEKLFRLKRRRNLINAADITEMLKDPDFRAMVELRKAIKEAGKRFGKDLDIF